MVDVSFMSDALDNFLISRMNDLLLSETNQIKGGQKGISDIFSFSIWWVHKDNRSRNLGGRASIAAL
jgi:hypothetical protein